MSKFVAVYVRVSSKKQDLRSQLPDLRRWAENYANGETVRWFTDRFTGKTMNRPGWQKIENALRDRKVSRIVIWRMDRLGRTCRGLTKLFEELVALRVPLVSLRDNIDLETTTGRLVAHILASVAQWENECRGERVAAGQAAARAAGKRWGGSKRGRRISITDEQVAMVRRLKAEGESIAAIARTVRLSRPSVYRLLANGNANGRTDS